ncbi:MAG TPA: four helix bundle protein [Terriglobia bacterium]|nr:four helix bundle protein [Terriglobia bacterium]
MEQNSNSKTNRVAPDIRERTVRCSVRAIELYRFVQRGRDGAGRIIAKQYLRAATSIEANVEEAHSGESRADFIHKFGIAQKEARECSYWLRIMADSTIVSSQRLAAIRRETEEIYAGLTAIIVNAKRKSKSQARVSGG